MKVTNYELRLYAVTDRTWLGERKLSEQVREAILGGVTFVQLREKNIEREEFISLANDVKEITDQFRIPFVINDNVEVAIEVSADGVHVGQEDMEVKKVRDLIGTDKILGVSVQTVQQAIQAEKDGADYLGVGAIFSTDSKADATNVTIATLKSICQSVKIPVVAIGGININNVQELNKSGIAGIAVISAIFSKDNIAEAATVLKDSVKSIVS